MLRVITLLIATALGLPAAAQEPVDLELVLAVDVSQSMDPDEQLIQRNGYVAALTHPEVIAAITGGVYGRIALSYVEWAGPIAGGVVVPWTLIDGEASALAFAQALAAAPIRRYRGTSISSGLLMADTLFESSPYEGLRRVIDISGDGANNMGPPVHLTRDMLVAKGITINGLPLVLRPSGPGGLNGPELAIYYEDCVIGGAGAFALAVLQPEQLPETIRRKLVLEIAGRPPALIRAQLDRGAPRIDCLIGERRWGD